jgi:hypothetical protein
MPMGGNGGNEALLAEKERDQVVSIKTELCIWRLAVETKMPFGNFMFECPS